MSNSLLKLEIEGSQLFAVPAKPYTVTFAKHVNKICRMQDTKPDAIAVELGPQSTKECALWLKELNKQRELPCVLALAKKNNRIRSSHKELADKLQETFGKDLNDLPIDILKHLLNYSSKSLFPLSPTDSVVEAIRCALELGIPLYGVDLEENADAKCKKAVIEDAASTHGKALREYVQRNIRYAELSRDNDIDERREFAIVARLKSLLRNYKRILFTGGLAHWGNIEILLEKPDLRPAQIKEVNEVFSGKFTRCIVDPLLAIYFMDIFPAFAGYYDHNRTSVDSYNQWHIESIDVTNPLSLFDEILKKTYEKYFEENCSNKQNELLHKDIQERTIFEQLLSNLCTVRRMMVPDLPTIIEAAQGSMSTHFSEALANNFMEFNWVTNREYPELPIIRPAPLQTGPYMKAEFQYPDGSRSEQFYLNLLHNRRSIMSGVSIPWKRKELSFPGNCSARDQEIFLNDNKPGFDFADVRTWPPRDYLITAMSLDAEQIAKRRGYTSILFQGSLHDGLDIKTTVRSYIRGENQIYVRDKSVYEAQQDAQEYNFDPVVWILDPFNRKTKDSAWNTYTGELLNVKKFVRNPQKLEHIKREKGANYLAAAVRGTQTYESKDIQQKGIYSKFTIQGIVYFILPFCTPEQDGAFLEGFNYEKCPIYNGEIDGLFNTIKKRYGIDLEVTDWPISLVRMAIIYAQQKVTVIVPDNFVLNKIVHEDARKAKIELNVTPLSYFPQRNIEKIGTNYAVFTLAGSDGEKYPESAERYLGEKADNNLHLVPKWLVNFGKALKAVTTT